MKKGFKCMVFLLHFCFEIKIFKKRFYENEMKFIYYEGYVIIRNNFGGLLILKNYYRHGSGFGLPFEW